jgi:hypothetical protein
MKRLGMAGLALVLLLGLAIGTAEAKKKVKVKTSPTLEEVTYAPVNVFTFSGDVDSLKKGCQRKREVEVRFLGSDDFPPNSYGTTESDGSGHWELTTTEPLPIEGDYQVTAERRTLNKKRKKIVCKVGKSPAAPIVVAAP